MLEVVYYKRNAPIYQAGEKFITNVMAYRMGYSLDTVRDTAYIPAEYKDYEWSSKVNLARCIIQVSQEYN